MYPEFPVETEHSLPYLCYDQYIIDGDVDIFTHGCISVDDFLSTRPVSVRAPCTGKRGDHDDDIQLPGEQHSHQVTSEVGKKITRTTFEAIWCVFQTGRCFETIEKKHLFVSPDGSVRFWGVQIAERERLDEWKDLLRQNLRAAAAILEVLFLNAGHGIIPPEINHLFDMVKADDKDKNIDLYHIHASLVPIGVGWLMFQKLFDHVRAKIHEHTRDDIYRSLEPFLVDWRVRAQDNDLLKTTYAYQPGSYDVDDNKIATDLGITLGQFLAKSAEERKDLKVLFDAKKFFEYLRNRGAHRLEGWMKVDSFYRNNGGQEYTAEGSDYVFQVRWGVVVCHIQKKLSDYGELANLKLSHFFSGLYPKGLTISTAPII